MNKDLPTEIIVPTINLLDERLSNQLADFERRLLASDTRTVLDRAGEYVTKRDFCVAFENAKLNGRELTALVSIPDLLDRLYKHWAARDELTSDMPDIIKSIRLFTQKRTMQHVR